MKIFQDSEPVPSSSETPVQVEEKSTTDSSETKSEDAKNENVTEKEEGKEEVKKDVVSETSEKEQPINGVKDEPREEAKPVSVKRFILFS